MTVSSDWSAGIKEYYRDIYSDPSQNNTGNVKAYIFGNGVNDIINGNNKDNRLYGELQYRHLLLGGYETRLCQF